ncbi:MAG: hypothetical protein MJZ61_09985 [Bacteroidales bacterium]|nr:hypothetical protein [Bacteroidales bacterium]
MKRIFYVACAALALTFASCGSKNAEQKATDAAEQATEQAAEATQAAAEEVKEVVNEVFVALQTKMNDFMAKVEASSKADLPALTDELKGIKAEFEAASLSEDESATLKALSEKIVEALKNLK